MVLRIFFVLVLFLISAPAWAQGPVEKCQTISKITEDASTLGAIAIAQFKDYDPGVANLFKEWEPASPSFLACLIAFRSSISRKDIEKVLTELELQPASVRELLAFSAQTEQAANGFPIVELHEQAATAEGPKVAYVILGEKRKLRLMPSEEMWSPEFYFLAVPITKPGAQSRAGTFVSVRA